MFAVRLWIAHILVALVLTSCSQTKPKEELGRLRISFNSFPVTADPRKSGDFISSTLICMIFDGLTRCLPDGSVELAVAKGMEISPDQLTYTFYLRKSFWTDGSPVTAYDFERSWKQVLNPSFPALCPYLLYSIKNAEKARKGLVSADQIGIKALNDMVLEVVLERPTPYFLSLTAFPTFLPVPPNSEAQFDRLGGVESLTSNGPFSLTSIKPNAELVLTKNEKFWNKTQIKLSEINISIVAHEMTAWKMFERGELDWLGGAISPLPMDSLHSMSSQYHMQFNPMAATTFCTFNNQHPYLSNKNLRKALSLAINRTEITEQITQLGETAATRCIPPSLMGFRNKTLYQPFDAELARLHLEKALEELHIEREDLFGISLSFAGTQLNRQLAQALQRQWKVTLNVDIALNQCEPNTLRDRLIRHDYQMALHYWIAQYSDPINILERFQDIGNAKNLPGWFNETYRDLVQKANQKSDPIDRMELIEIAEQIFINEMPLAPIYHWTNPSVCQSWVKNMLSTPNGGILFERCWVIHH
ncbi:MAG: oppA-E [Parachlamydiales bacterium]|nr:oppA-E [Parachlamydiales bacterium]